MQDQVTAWEAVEKPAPGVISDHLRRQLAVFLAPLLVDLDRAID